jgi:hypothetical protein
MPVEIKMKSTTGNDQFFLKLLPTSAVSTYKSLCSAGVGFNLAFYSVTADLSKLGMANVSVTLPTSTTSLLKGTADASVVHTSLVQLIALLNDVMSSVHGKAGPLENGTNPCTEIEMPTPAKESAVKKPVLMAKVEPTTEGGIVRLAQATQVGQPVRGSSGGSVYYAMALSDQVKLAVRVKKNGSVSIRAEGTPPAHIVQRLHSAGMSKAGSEHWSIHFDAVDVPVSRCVGAFLMGLEIPFDSQITNFSQVKVEA